MLLVLMAFMGCNRGPAMFERPKDKSQFVSSVEKFVKQTEKKSKHYSAEDWKVAVEQFTVMSKEYVGVKDALSEQDQMRWDNARVKFMGVINANGTEEIAKQVKEIYSNVLR